MSDEESELVLVSQWRGLCAWRPDKINTVSIYGLTVDWWDIVRERHARVPALEGAILLSGDVPGLTWWHRDSVHKIQNEWHTPYEASYELQRHPLSDRGTWRPWPADWGDDMALVLWGDKTPGRGTFRFFMFGNNSGGGTDLIWNDSFDAAIREQPGAERLILRDANKLPHGGLLGDQRE